MFLCVTVCRETVLGEPDPPKKHKTPSSHLKEKGVFQIRSPLINPFTSMKQSGLDADGAYCSKCGIFCYAYSFDLSRILED